MEYPIDDNLEHAIRRLFDDPNVAYGLLGKGVPWAQRDVTCTPEVKPAARVELLRQKLESYIVQMATEVDELGADELPRLRTEATALLLALREIQSHFPDVIGESRPTV